MIRSGVMASARQRAANRENAKRSTGPRTAAGKRRSSRNSQTHGLTGKGILLLEGEDEEVFQYVQSAIHREWQPETVTQKILVELLIAVNWRLMRSVQFESGVIAWAQSKCGSDRPLLKSLPQNDYADMKALGCAIERIFTEGDLLTMLARYERDLLKRRADLIEQLQQAKRSHHSTVRQMMEEVRRGHHRDAGGGSQQVEGDPARAREDNVPELREKICEPSSS
jgi:hypothetical protein